jgi:phosphate-selective porin OprO and OprP
VSVKFKKIFTFDFNRYLNLILLGDAHMINRLKFAFLICLTFTLTAASQVTSVGPGRGISFSAENVSVRSGGRIQVRHTYDGESELSNFNVPRLRLALSGSLYTNWKWEFQSDFARDRQTTLKDGLVEYAFSDQFNIRFGQYKVRFDRQQLESSGRQTFVDRALAAGNLGLARDVGLLVHGRTDNRVFQYSAGIFNGSGEGQANVADRGHMLVGRISINPLGDFGLSQGDIGHSDKHLVFIDFAFAQQPDEEESFEGTTRFVTGAGYRYSGLYLAGEYYNRKTGTDVTSDGFYAQASYTVIKNELEIAARYSQFDPNTDIDNILRTELMGGVNLFFNGLGHNLKLSGDVAFLKNEAVSDDSYFRTRVQVQLVF